MSSAKSFLAVVSLRAVGLLPLGWARSLGSGMGRLAYRLDTRMSKTTRRNLTVCLPQLNPKSREQLVRESLRETGKVAAEICVIWGSPRKSARDYITHVDGEDLAKLALAEGKGLIILAPHLGNWEVLGLHLATLGEVVNLYQPPKLQALDAVIRRSREKSGCRLVPTNAKGVAALLKSLKNNGISGILPDQNPNSSGSGAYAPFFGEPAFTMILIHKLLQRTGSKAVFAFAKRVKGGFELVYREAPKDIYSDDMTASLAALNQGIEALIMEAPEQYQWEYNRFKKRF